MNSLLLGLLGLQHLRDRDKMRSSEVVEQDAMAREKLCPTLTWQTIVKYKIIIVGGRVD